MAQVDILRFVKHIPELFALKIQEGQEFTFYIDEDNAFPIQGDNINVIESFLNFEWASLSEDITKIKSTLSSLSNKVDELKDTVDALAPENNS